MLARHGFAYRLSAVANKPKKIKTLLMYQEVSSACGAAGISPHP